MAGFVVFQAGFAIMGVGATPEAAIADAASNLGPGDVLPPVAEAPRSGGLVVGRLYVAPAGDDVLAVVAERGGSVDYYVDAGRVVLV
jgi:hypothetical protein